jgi:hypothetical protein
MIKYLLVWLVTLYSAYCPQVGREAVDSVETTDNRGIIIEINYLHWKGVIE